MMLHMKDALREIVRKDEQLMDERAKLIKALSKLTERNEKLASNHSRLKNKYEEQQRLQSRTVAALEEQNGLLRKMVEEKEDEITDLEGRLARWESGENGVNPWGQFLHENQIQDHFSDGKLVVSSLISRFKLSTCRCYGFTCLKFCCDSRTNNQIGIR